LISYLKEGEKASLNISIDFKRVDNTDTMVTVNYKLIPKFPGIKKASICQIGKDNGIVTSMASKNISIEEYQDTKKVVNLKQGGKKHE